MSNEDELVKTLINKNKKQKQKQKKPNNEQPQQMNKLVIDYDQVVIALPHFPKPPKIRINGPKTLLDHTPIKGLFDETKTKKKKKKIRIDEKNETQMGNGVYSNGVDEFDGKDSSFEGKKKKKKKENLDERNETQMGKGVYSNGVDAFEGKEKKKKENLGERDETQMGKGVCSNGVDDFEGLNKVMKRKYGWSKDESVECRFPVNRIVRIIKSQGDDYKLGHEAVFLINKATEKFIELFSEDAYDCALEDKKSFVGYRHLSSAVAKEKRLDFLSDYVPEKITGEKALASRNAAETPLT